MLRSLVLALVVASACLRAEALAHSHKLKGFEIVHPWCFETRPPDKTVAVYMVIKNEAQRPDRLLGAKSSTAQKIELREPAAGGTQTRRVAALDVKGGQELILKRAGPHLLLSGLARRLSAYESFAMTLIFERAGKIEVEVVVEEAAAGEPEEH